MIQSRIIDSARNVALSAKSQDWDSKFLDALALTTLDLTDHTLIMMAWAGEKVRLLHVLLRLTLHQFCRFM